MPKSVGLIDRGACFTLGMYESSEEKDRQCYIFHNNRPDPARLQINFGLIRLCELRFRYKKMSIKLKTVAKMTEPG